MSLSTVYLYFYGKYMYIYRQCEMFWEDQYILLLVSTWVGLKRVTTIWSVSIYSVHARKVPVYVSIYVYSLYLVKHQSISHHLPYPAICFKNNSCLLYIFLIIFLLMCALNIYTIKRQMLFQTPCAVRYQSAGISEKNTVRERKVVLASGLLS